MSTRTHYDRETLIDFLHGELAPAADAAVFAHLDGCEPCRLVRDEESSITETLRGSSLAQERELPAMVRARIWDAVRRETPSFGDRVRALWRPALALPVAAAVALVAYIGLPVMHGSPDAAGVTAAYLLDEHSAEAQQNPLGPGMAPAMYSPDQSDVVPTTAVAPADAASIEAGAAH